MTKSVLFTIPNLHWNRVEVTKRTIQILQDGRYSVRWEPISRKPYVNNLHHCVNMFLESGKDFWLSMDVDNPPRANPLDLVELDKDVIGLPTPIWHFKGEKEGERPIYYNAFDYVSSGDCYKEHLPYEGLQEVDAVGTGCFLIARRVFENKELQKGAFHRVWNEDGTVKTGNDLAFCARAKEQGFRIWCHYDYPCDHFFELNLNEVAKAFILWKKGI